MPTPTPQGAQQDNALSVNGLLCRVRNQVSLWLRHKNPFVDHTPQPDRDTSVLTFEISWADIVGIDFKWPLTEDARLVLEASLMAKRVFDNVSCVVKHASVTVAAVLAVWLPCWVVCMQQWCLLWVSARPTAKLPAWCLTPA